MLISFGTVLVLLGMGVAGGFIGGIAGGAGLLTFPAFLLSGIDPATANASNFLALIPLGLSAALASKGRLVGKKNEILALVPTVTVGALAGVTLLMLTPGAVFNTIFPILLAAATTLFLFGPSATNIGVERTSFGWGKRALLFFVSIYSGYFGAGSGIVLLAALLWMDWTDVHQANAVKNMLLSLSSIACVAILAAGDRIAWSETLVVMVGVTAGGYFGGTFANIVSARHLRLLILLIGYGLAMYYAVDSWMLR